MRARRLLAGLEDVAAYVYVMPNSNQFRGLHPTQLRALLAGRLAVTFHGRVSGWLGSLSGGFGGRFGGRAPYGF